MDEDDQVQEIGFNIFKELKHLSGFIDGGEESLESLVTMIMEMKGFLDQYKIERDSMKGVVNSMTLKIQDLDLQLQKETSLKREAQERLHSCQEETEEEKDTLIRELERLQHLPFLIKKLESQNRDLSDEVDSLNNRLHVLQKLYDQETTRSRSLLLEKTVLTKRQSLSVTEQVDHEEDWKSLSAPSSRPLSLEVDSTFVKKAVDRGVQTTKDQEDDEDVKTVKDFLQIHEKRISGRKVGWKTLLYVLLSFASLSNILGIIVDPVYISWQDILGFETQPREGRFVPV
jgi:predicted  nucleic acid-binding Zn-ribbon protein